MNEAPESPEMREVYDRFNKGVARATAIAGGLIIPVGLILSAVFAGWRGLVGGLVGFGVASLNTIASMALLKWSFKRPSGTVPAMITSIFIVRMFVLLGVLYVLTLQHAFNIATMLACFFALFLAYQIVEAYFSYRTFGIMTGKQP